MIVRGSSGFPRRVYRAGPGVVRARGVFGPRRYGYGYGGRRYYGGAYRPYLRGVYGGARLAPWVRGSYYGRYRPWYRRYYGTGFPFSRTYFPRLAAPWLRGRFGASYLPYLRRRPWLFRSPLPFGGYAPAPIYDAPPVLAAPIIAPPPEPAVVAAPPPPDDAAAPTPDAAEPPAGGPPADAAPSDGAAGAPPDAGAAPGGAPDGAAPPAGELPQTVATDGKRVRIRWDKGVRSVTDAAPPGGGVYVVYRDGRPETAHMTNDFRTDIAKRFAGELESEGELEGQSEFWRRRGGGRRRRYARYGRFRGGRFGRWQRIRMLRRLRYLMNQQGGDDQDSPPEGDDDMQGG